MGSLARATKANRSVHHETKYAQSTQLVSCVGCAVCHDRNFPAPANKVLEEGEQSDRLTYERMSFAHRMLQVDRKFSRSPDNIN